MKLTFRHGLRGRMLVSIGATVLVGIALIVSVVGVQASRQARAAALVNAENLAQLASRDAAIPLNEAMTTARALAGALAGLAGQEGVASRSEASAMLRHALDSNANLLGVWTVWEPNAFDGKDAEAANRPGHDATGRFIPYWNRAGGGIALEAVRDYATDGAGDFYLLPKRTNRETVLEPYLYRVGGSDVLLTTLAVPIHGPDHAVVGVVGVDLSLQSLAQQVKATKIGDHGYASLVSGAGIYVAHPNVARIGKPILESDPWVKPHLDQIRQGAPFLARSYSRTLGSDTFRVGSPLRVGHDGASWCAVVTIPENEVLAAARGLTRTIVGIGAGVLVAVIAVVLVLTTRITRPIREMADSLAQASDQTAAASGQVSAASQSLAQGANEQASSLEETSASCEELAGMTKRNAEHAAQAKTLASEARADADHGAADMREMASAMSELREAGASVAKIVKTIDQIAFQTNILALNAAVEAARAGEAGMGFAVVAEEVRSLAQRSAHAAKETAATIETTIQRSERGYTLTENVTGMLDRMVRKVRQVDELVAQISSASEEQSQGIRQINTALIQMESITQQTAAQAEETASASEELSGQAELLKQTVFSLTTLVNGAQDAASTVASPASRVRGSPPHAAAVRARPPRVERSSHPATLAAGRS